MLFKGAVDLDAINDPHERAAAEAQISSFGNTPSQLLTKPHAPRASTDVPTVCSTPGLAKLHFERRLSQAALLYVAPRGDQCAANHFVPHRRRPYPPLSA